MKHQHSTPGDEERKERIKANGLECLRRLKNDQTWEDWRGTGEALMVITEETMADLGATEWDKDNKRLVKEFVKRWEAYESTAGSNHKPLTKQERWALREVMTNSEIEVWRGLLDGPQKRRLNHPNAVVNKWRASTQTREPKRREPSPALSPALAERDRKIAELEARAAELGEELKGAREKPRLTLEDGSEAIDCSFCGKSQLDVVRMIKGGDATICNECVTLCTDIVREAQGGDPGAHKGAFSETPDGTLALVKELFVRATALATWPDTAAADRARKKLVPVLDAAWKAIEPKPAKTKRTHTQSP